LLSFHCPLAILCLVRWPSPMSCPKSCLITPQKPPTTHPFGFFQILDTALDGFLF
jgi:hypothetical protein